MKEYAMNETTGLPIVYEEESLSVCAELICSSNDNFITDDFIPDYEEDDSIDNRPIWDKYKWWIIGIIIGIPVLIFITWFITIRSHCDKIDSRFCPS
jgi:hypothetical protein